MKVIATPRILLTKTYFWFCSTHLIKACHGQLYGSSSKGKKAFQDKYCTDFGWRFVEKLHNRLQVERKESDGKVSDNIWLNKKGVSPVNQLEMSVPLAKIVFEHQTIPSAINCVCDELGISSKELERATADKRSEYPYMRTSSSTEHNSDMRHCDNLEKIFSLQKCAKKRDVDSNAASSNTANEVDLSLEMPILHDVTLDAAVMSDDN